MFVKSLLTLIFLSDSSLKDEDYDLDNTYLDFGESSSKRLPHENDSDTVSSCQQTKIRDAARRLADSDKVLEKSVLQPGLEKQHALPSYDEGRRLMLRKRKV